MLSRFRKPVLQWKRKIPRWPLGYGWTHFPHQMVTRQAHGPLPRAPHSLLQDADSLRTFSSVVRSIPNPFNFPPVSPCAPQGTVSFLGTRAFWSMAEFCDNIYSTFIFCHVKKKKKNLMRKGPHWFPAAWNSMVVTNRSFLVIIWSFLMFFKIAMHTISFFY